LQTLEAKDAVKRTDGGGYRLGEAIAEIETRYGTANLPRLAYPILRDLHATTGETVNLAVADDAGMLVVVTVQSEEPLRMVSWEGMRDLFHASALGKSYLAALPDSELESLLKTVPLVKRTARTTTKREVLLRQLRRISTAGYAVDDGESTEGVRCVGAAITADGRPVAALSVSAPASRLPKKSVSEYGQAVARAAEAISAIVSKSLPTL
jgi:IclR family acetate operon transcriptional repressor